MASIIKADNIQKVSDGTNIIKKCGSTITLGSCGATISLAAGATQTGFGRTGTVDWDTTAKTTNFTAVSGTGYFVNTTSGAITLTLPATPSAGDIVAFKDYAFTFATNNFTVDGNGQPIGGVNAAVSPTYSINGTSKTFIYVDGTKGWLVTNESTDTSQEVNPAFVTATGGTITTCGDYKIHTFTSDGTFCVSCAGNIGGSNTVSYLIVAGGGGGGFDAAGGGGAGGYREGKSSFDSYTSSPLDAGSGLPVSVTAYPIIVGGGGQAGTGPGSSRSGSGSNSSFSTITSTGGGASFSLGGTPDGLAKTGGSGGGGGRGANGAAGNTPPVSPPQGNPGGNSSNPLNNMGGGGGATAAGGCGASPTPTSIGGAGATTSISGSSASYAGGGGGNHYTPDSNPALVAGGTGGGGNGARGSVSCATAGSANTGGGGGGSGGSTNNQGASGGSGIVIIRYKYQ